MKAVAGSEPVGRPIYCLAAAEAASAASKMAAEPASHEEGEPRATSHEREPTGSSSSSRGSTWLGLGLGLGLGLEAWA